MQHSLQCVRRNANLIGAITLIVLRQNSLRAPHDAQLLHRVRIHGPAWLMMMHGS